MVKTTNLGVGVMVPRVRELALYTSISRFAAEHRLVQSGGLRAGLARLCILRSGESMSEANLVGGSQRDREQIGLAVRSQRHVHDALNRKLPSKLIHVRGLTLPSP